MSVLRKRFMSVAGVAAAASAAVVFAAGPAAAEVFDVNTRASGSYLAFAGSMNFQSVGEHISTCDNSSDGAGVIGYWKVGSGGTVHPLYAGGGRGTCERVNASASESSYVYLKVCIRNNGNVIEGTCSAWDYFYAGA
ncbi:hypothetical protein ACWGH2_39890 [Streptomyces sp. NPDC054871]